MTRALLVSALVLLLLPAAALARPSGSPAPATLAIIGDTPYGDAQVANFPNDVAAINADPAVSRVVHVGDIKNGSSVCSDGYFNLIKTDFDGFADPLVYTPGDNEWTDCHRLNNGGYNPLERLAKVRSVFFPVTGQTLGQEVPIRSQRGSTPENTLWFQGGAEFGTIHIVGSNNSLLPWTGNTEPTPEQLAEVRTRTAAALRWIDRIFARAHANKAAGVAIGTQADMWDPTAQRSGFERVVDRLAQRAHAFHKPVLLLEGDSHAWRVDHPLTPGDSLYGTYDTPVDAPNFTRVVVQGDNNCPRAYLRLRVDAASPNVFSGQNVPLPPFGCTGTTPTPGSF
jgi:hypothetical protein